VTVGFFSPLPPARTGVADYAASLLAALRELGPVEVDAARADVNLYHLGNNQLHREIYAQALQRRGVAVLHDAVLHHFFLGWLDRERYLDEFAYNYGEWNRGLAQKLWEERPRSALDPRYFRYAMVRRIAETSRAIIVHNPGAAALVRSHAPAARVVEIPHLFAAPHPVGDARQELAVGPQTFLFAVFGHLRESKRLFAVLHAFERVRAAGVDAALLIAGDFVSTDLERAIAPLLEPAGVLRRGYAAEPQFWRLAAAADACINLRYPAAGETSGIGIRLMGIGKPVIMTAGAEVSAFPEDTCLRVDPGAAEVPMLAEYMTWLAGRPDYAREIGRRAQEHIHARHSLEAVANEYWRVMISV
jgi:glycosyltransferase involved in cell wall biosynthesis